MDNNGINLLIVEDCKIIAQAYKGILKEASNLNLKISFAKNCDEAETHILNKKTQIVLLDLHIPNSKNTRYISGEDLGLLIRKASPDTKILIITANTDQTRILSIINEFQPEGFMTKSDIESKDLKTAISQILKGKKYYSKTIKKFTKKISENGIIIDDFDRQILYHLSMGEKTKNLTKFIPLSTRAIEVRKTKLKNLFDNGNEDNFNLVKAAKKRGII